VSATTYPKRSGVLGLLVVSVTGTSYLSDTGSVYSLLPHNSTSPPSGPSLVTADGKPVACWGSCVRDIHLGGRVLTDHKPLTFVISRQLDAWSACQQRQLSFIAEYTSDLQHVVEADNVVADALSRPACTVLPVEGGKIDLKQLAVAQSTCEASQLWHGKPNVQAVQVEDVDLLCDSSTGALRPIVPTS